MCDSCGIPNDVLKARRWGLAYYSATHQKGCASFTGHLCDCDPVLTPAMPTGPAKPTHQDLWPDAIRVAAQVAARQFLAAQGDKKAATMRGAGWDERELTRMLMEAYDLGAAHMANMMAAAMFAETGAGGDA